MLENTIIPRIIYTALKPVKNKVEAIIPFLAKDFKLKSKEQGEKSPEQKGSDEHAQNAMREKEDAKSKVDQLVRKSNRRIISINSFSLFPFGLFTNTIEIEESRIIFIFKQIFSFQSHIIDISDISNVFIDSDFLFAQMRIVSRTYTQNEITIGYLSKNKANRVRMIIEGLRIFSKSKIDTSVYSVDELIQKLGELHQVRN